MTEIYMVTTGEYSDYCVHYGFTTRERAEEVAAMFRHGADVEEFQLYGPGEDPFQRYPRFRAILSLDERGNALADVEVIDISDVGQEPPELDEPVTYTSYRYVRYSSKPQASNERWTLLVEGRSEEQARKALSERLAVAVADIEAGVDPVTKLPPRVTTAPGPDYTNVYPYSVQKPIG